MKTMCGGLFSFCFLHETVFGNGQVAITHNEFINTVTAFTMPKMEYKHNRRKQNEDELNWCNRNTQIAQAHNRQA